MEAILLFIIKIVLSSAMVIGITVVAEKGNPRLAGVLMGFPLGAGLALFFLGVEQGTAFASQSALWSIPGVLAMLAFCLGYSKVSLFYQGRSLPVIALCTTVGIICYFSAAYLLQHFLPETTLGRTATLLIGIPLFALLLRNPSTNVTSTTISPSASTKRSVLLARAGFASSIIIIITAIANSVGPTWSGLFATFPTAILPSVLILHRKNGSNLVPLLFRETTFGMLAIVVFAIAVHFFFPPFGVYLGVLLAYAVSFFYLFVYERSIRRPLTSLFRIR